MGAPRAVGMQLAERCPLAGQGMPAVACSLGWSRSWVSSALRTAEQLF